MAKLSPVFNDQVVDANGAPASGYKVFTYAAGSSTKQASYTDSAGLVAQTNPIILNSLGYPTSPIWLTEGQNYKFILTGPDDTDPPTSPIRTIDNVSGVGDSTVSISQWASSGLTPTYIGTNSFTFAGDQTANAHVGLRIQATTSGGTVYGTIIASVYDSLTTVTLLMDDSQVLDSGLSAVNFSILRADHLAEPFTNVAESIAGIKTFTSSPVVPSDFCWYTKAVGEPFFLRDDMAGVTAPPTDNAGYRYIKLTAADAYNTGVLTSESVTGSAPLVIATAVISLAGSPINGLTVNLLNTERRVIRAGSSGTVEQDSMQGHRHTSRAATSSTGGTNGLPVAASASSGDVRFGTGGTYQIMVLEPDTDSVNGTPRTATETRAKSQGATAYMRIK